MILFLVLVGLLALSFKFVGFLFRIFGKLLGLLFSVFGYVLLGIVAFYFLGLALTALPVLVIVGIIAIVVALIK